MAQIEKLHCRGCGAVLPVKAGASRIKCEYCGTVHLSDTQYKKDSGDQVCPYCGFANPANAQFCGDCGKSLFHTCPKCGTQNRMDSIFCSKCGADIDKIIREDGPYKPVNIDELYLEYVLEGKKIIWKINPLISIAAFLAGIVIFAGIMIWINTFTNSFDLVSIPFVEKTVTWVNSSNVINIGNFEHYGPALTILGFLFILIVASINNNLVNARAACIAKTKPGFDKFFKTIRRSPQQPGQPSGINWPDTLPDEKKRNEFLSLIGKK